MAEATTSSDEPAVRRQLDGIRNLLERQQEDRVAQQRGRVDRALGLAGSVLLPAGVIVILLGWYGAAHTPYVFEQVPYLISGGLLGVGMVVGGGLLFFGSWIARMEQDAPDVDRVVAAIDRLREELRGGGTAGVDGARANGAGRGFVATPTGTMIHRPDCAVVSGREDDGLVAVGPDDAGYRPCKLCDPLEAAPSARPESAT